MGVMSAWMFGWTAFGLAVLALAAAGGVYVVRALAGHGAVRDPVAVMPAPGLAEATAELAGATRPARSPGRSTCRARSTWNDPPGSRAAPPGAGRVS